MRSTLLRLIDKPVIVRTVPDDPSWKPLTGVVFEVREDAFDLLVGAAVLKTVRLAAVIDVVMDAQAAREMVLEDQPEDPSYPLAKRLLFEAEQAGYLNQPREAVQAKARAAAELLRAVRRVAPRHLGTEQMLERAHLIATGRYDYELEPAVSGGEVDNHNYRWAKSCRERLEEALRLRRPEEDVAGHVAALGRHAGRALAKYPAHAELRAWFDRAEAIRKKLSEGVQRANGLGEALVAGRD